MKYFESLNCKVLYDEPLKFHTTFGIGGNCRVLIEPTNTEEIVEIIKICKDKNLKYFLLGNGSNILVKDTGYDGVIIKIKDNFNKILVEDNKIISQSGATLSKIFNVALENSLSGFEFASGIPGTIGGAIFMNAGAYGGEMKDVVESVEVIDISTLEIKLLSNDELNFSYRHSTIQDNPYIVTKIVLQLVNGIYDEIENIYEDLRQKRNSKQPLNFKSAGSTFKRPEGFFAAKLIEDSELKGFRVNDAMVSEKHAGFVVNVGNASFEDVISVINHVKKVVREKFNVELEMEVKILGD